MRERSPALSGLPGRDRRPDGGDPCGAPL